MKNFILMFFLLFVSFTEIFAAPPVKRVIEPVLSVGDGTTQNIVIEADLGSGALNPKLQLNSATGKWEFINLGDDAKPLGSGSGSGGDGGVSVLLNGSMEDGDSNWTNTGGILTSQLYVNPAAGNEKYLRFIASGVGQYFEQTFLQWPETLTKGCSADMRYLQGAGLFEYKVIEDLAGTPKELASGSVSNLTKWGDAPSITFPCPESGESITIRIISTGAATIDIDDAYTGAGKGFSSGTYTNSIGLAGNGDEVLTANITNSPFIGSGNGWDSGLSEYSIQRSGSVVTFSGSVHITVSVAMQVFIYKNGSQYKLIDFDSSSNSFAFSYTSKAGEFLIGDKISFRINSTRQLSNNLERHYLNILEQSGETQEAWTPEQADFFIDVNIGGSDLSITDTAGGQVSFESAGLDMVLKNGSAKIPCSATNISTGLTCSVGSENVGAVFNAPRAGAYEICGQWLGGVNATGAYRWAETLDGSQAILQLGNSVAGGSSLGASAVNQENLCSLFYFNSSGEKALRLFYRGNSSVVAIRAARSSSLYNEEINITIKMVSHNISRPIIQNMVDTSIKDGTKTESCAINNNGTATIQTASGMCESWIDSVAYFSVGHVDINIKVGIFSRPPVCTVSIRGDVNRHCGMAIDGTTTAQRVDCGRADVGNENHNFNIECKGAR